MTIDKHKVVSVSYTLFIADDEEKGEEISSGRVTLTFGRNARNPPRITALITSRNAKAAPKLKNPE